METGAIHLPIFQKNPVDENGKLTKDYNYKYYVEEVGVDNKNDLSGYTTSYIYTDQNGTAYGDINSGNTSKECHRIRYC